MKSILEIKNIYKSFGDRVILSGVDFHLEQGCIYTLMGANGSGKTTLFNIISGFLKAEDGTVIFKNKTLTNLSPVAVNSCGITRTFQNLRLINGLTVRENIHLAFKGNKGEKIWNALLPGAFFKEHQIGFKRSADDIINKVFLDDVADNKAGKISYGQQKLLTLGCCIANDAELFLLDEPVAGINPLYKKKIVTLVKGFKAAGKTILLIEHNADFIAAVSDKLFFLANGIIDTFEDYQQLKDNLKVQEAYL
ncbi:MAG: ATP-binding cassette domain-containing protein [Pseudomonadota bacterium]